MIDNHFFPDKVVFCLYHQFSFYVFNADLFIGLKFIRLTNSFGVAVLLADFLTDV